MSHKHYDDLFEAIAYAFGPVLIVLGVALFIFGLVMSA